MGSYTSFVVRIWSDEQTRMHGTVQHVASRDSLAFRDLQAMVAFILSHVGPAGEDVPGFDPEPSEQQGQTSDDSRHT